MAINAAEKSIVMNGRRPMIHIRAGSSPNLAGGQAAAIAADSHCGRAHSIGCGTIHDVICNHRQNRRGSA